MSDMALDVEPAGSSSVRPAGTSADRLVVDPDPPPDPATSDDADHVAGEDRGGHDPRRPPSVGRRRRPGVGWIALGLAVLVPVLVLVGLSRRQRPIVAELAGNGETTTVQARAEVVRPRRVLRVVAPATPPAVLRSLAPPGIVTRVDLRPGRILRQGDEVAEVDGASLVAMHTERPLWRSLGIGDTGPDVDGLHRALDEMGLLPPGASLPDGSSFQWASIVGVRRLADRAHRPATDRFDPAWVVWLPAREVAVGRSEVAVGTPLAAAPAELASVLPVAPAKLVDAAGREVPLTELAGWTVPAAAGNPSVGDHLAAATVQRAARGDPAPAGPPAGVAPGPATGSAQDADELIVEGPEAVPALAVPLTAVVDRPGGSCVVIRSTAGDRAQPVDVVTTRGLSAWVTGIGTGADVDVVVDPARGETTARCR